MNNPIVKYKTDSSNKIEKVECIRETDRFVVFKVEGCLANTSGERREAKDCGFWQYHDSWDAAHSFLLDRAIEKVTEVRRRLEYANGILGNIKGMKNPEVT